MRRTMYLLYSMCYYDRDFLRLVIFSYFNWSIRFGIIYFDTDVMIIIYTPRFYDLFIIEIEIENRFLIRIKNRFSVTLYTRFLNIVRVLCCANFVFLQNY